MSRADVEAVFGPQWVQDARASDRTRFDAAERHVIALRSWLRTYNKALPDPRDGTAWEAAVSDFVASVEAKP